MRDADEQAICGYLALWRGQWLSGTEICRRAATRKRFNHDPKWAYPALERLVEQKAVESDSTGHYRLAPPPKRKRALRHLSPHVREILERSGRNFDGVISIEEDDGSM
jgi:hypothetical protein